jgi:hypothetical protein
MEELITVLGGIDWITGLKPCVVSLAGNCWALDPPGRNKHLTNEPNGYCSFQEAAEPLGKASFKSGLTQNNLRLYE